MDENKMEQQPGMDSEAIKALEEENERLRLENERLQSLGVKERLYERIHISVKTLDMIIAGLCLLFVLVVILGMLK